MMKSIIAFVAIALSLTAHHSALSEEPPASAVCGHDPYDPIVGCWHLVHEEALPGAILNVKQDGSWYDGTAKSLAANSREYLWGPFYRSFDQVGMGPYFELIWENQFRSSWSGPFFAVECSVMELRNYWPTDQMMKLLGADGKNPLYRGVRLNTKFVTEDMFELQGPLSPEMMPHPGAEPQFEACRNNMNDFYGMPKLLGAASLVAVGPKIYSALYKRYFVKKAATTSKIKKLGALFRNGNIPRASALVAYATTRGWKLVRNPNGPMKYVDKNGVIRLTVKRGSSRAPGSSGPHVEIRNSSGQRVDPFGNPVTRKGEGNHSPIFYDLIE